MQTYHKYLYYVIRKDFIFPEPKAAPSCGWDYLKLSRFTETLAEQLWNSLQIRKTLQNSQLLCHL